jgi:hypothetical protein
VNATVLGAGAGTVAGRNGRTRPIRNRAPRGGRGGRRGQPQARPNHLRLVVDHGRVIDQDLISRPSARLAEPVRKSEAEPVAKRDEPVAKREAVNAPRRAAAAPRPGERVPGRRPVRLTRRGRLVVTSAVVLLIAVASMVLAGAAQAAGHP